MFFQQVAAGLEAVSGAWNFNAYALVPIGETEQKLNSHYNGGALDTYGLDVGYFITPDINALVGYYQQGDLGDGDSSESGPLSLQRCPRRGIWWQLQL